MATVRNAHADVRAATAPIARAPKMLRILRAGDLDLFVGNRLSTNTEIVANELWIGDGLGGFTAASGNPAGGTKNTNCAAWADIDGDGNYHAFTYARPLSVRPRSPRCRLPSRAQAMWTCLSETAFLMGTSCGWYATDRLKRPRAL